MADMNPDDAEASASENDDSKTPVEMSARPSTDAAEAGATSTFELVARAQAGDRTALDELLVRCLPSLHRWAHGRLPMYARGALDTDDLVQQAAYRTLMRLHLFEPRHVYSLQAYLREAVVNRIRDVVRQQLRRGVDEELVDNRSDERVLSPLEEVIRQETVRRYWEALKQLRPNERRAVILRIEMELSFDELAKRLGNKSSGAARMATNRALGRLARILGHTKRQQ
jgi:RNA polymerase sigma factor (sigma-70 family)